MYRLRDFFFGFFTGLTVFGVMAYIAVDFVAH